MASIFKSPVFWGGVVATAVVAGVTLHRKRGLLGRGGAAGPPPVLVMRNPAKTPVAVETRHVDGMTLRRS